MFSGKTEELIRRLRRAQIARQSVVVVKPKIDDRYDAEFDTPETRHSARVAMAAFEMFGGALYPDGNFTPRLSYGVVAGTEIGDRRIVATTTIGGLFERATGAAPYALPRRWLDA